MRFGKECGSITRRWGPRLPVGSSQGAISEERRAAAQNTASDHQPQKIQRDSRIRPQLRCLDHVRAAFRLWGESRPRRVVSGPFARRGRCVTARGRLMRGDGWIRAHGGGTSRAVSSRFRVSLGRGFSSFDCTSSDRGFHCLDGRGNPAHVGMAHCDVNAEGVGV